ncbi:reverse transcriptase domain-containing protein [Tanacetum coccineum]
MHTRASNSELVEPLPEPERTLNRRLHRQNRRVLYDQRNNPPQHPRIIYSPILHINYFRHFLVILRNYDPMDDESIDTENEAIRLMMFPLSLTGEAKTWLNELNKVTIETCDELRTDFISRFFPSALFDRLLREIRAFSQHENESLTDAWLPRMDAMTVKMDAQYKELQSRAKQPTPNLDDDDIPMSLKEEAKFMQTFLIRVKNKQLNLGVGTERMIFNIDSAMKHSYSNDDTCFSIDVVDEIFRRYCGRSLDRRK